MQEGRGGSLILVGMGRFFFSGSVGQAVFSQTRKAIQKTRGRRPRPAPASDSLFLTYIFRIFRALQNAPLRFGRFAATEILGLCSHYQPSLRERVCTWPGLAGPLETVPRRFLGSFRIAVLVTNNASYCVFPLGTLPDVAFARN